MGCGVSSEKLETIFYDDDETKLYRDALLLFNCQIVYKELWGETNTRGKGILKYYDVLVSINEQHLPWPTQYLKFRQPNDINQLDKSIIRINLLTHLRKRLMYYLMNNLARYFPVELYEKYKIDTLNMKITDEDEFAHYLVDNAHLCPNIVNPYSEIVEGAEN